MKYIAFLLIAAILISLFSALLSIMRGKDSKLTAKALTLRISFSILLFAVLILSFYTGLWVPHQF